MKIFLVVLIVAVGVLSVAADYAWRRWMAERRRERG
jgi:hypothetical protein